MHVRVPDELDQALSPQWLTTALRSGFPGIEVVSVVPGPIVERISTNVRFAVECAGDPPPDLYPRLCLKGYFSEIGRAARAVGEAEAGFYTEIAALTGVRTLRSVFATVDSDTRHGVVITEDVIAQGGEFLDGNSPFTPEQAADSLTEYARLHAATWSDPRYADTPWLVPRMTRTLESTASWGLTAITNNYTGPNGAGMPARMRDPDRMVAAYRAAIDRVLAETASAGWCVVHGDAHVGNLFLDGDGRPALLDWQLVQRGMWYIDIGYHLASALTVEDRRRHEFDLLRHYLDQLAAFGVHPPPWEQAREDLSWGIVHGLFLWSITTQVEPSIIASLLHRIATAAADHDALGKVLRAAGPE
ncbi:MAG: phosphotransferase [Nocardia sp.]|nr:phosphotransferase [Nocardia sp.]